MKKLIKVSIVGLILTSVSIFATKSEILSNIEKIRIVTQGLSKNYFYKQQKIQISSARRGIKKNILSLDDSIYFLSKTLKNDEQKSLLEFMTFSVDELKITIKGKLTLENGGLVLDYTEAILEVADNLKSEMEVENNMLLILNEMKFLLERASKYYIAFRAGYKDPNNISQAKKAIKKFETLLVKVQKYNYPSHIKNGSVKKLSRYWPVSKNFYLGIKKSKLPTIVFISTKHMNRALEKLIKFHKSIK